MTTNPETEDRQLYYSETSDNPYVPSGYALMAVSGREYLHGHGPGNPIVWNNVQEAKVYNAQISALKKTAQDPDNLFYKVTYAYPTVGYNQHHHTSEFDGGLVYGAGLHAHSGPSDAGFAFAVYHPGTSLSPTQVAEIFPEGA